MSTLGEELRQARENKGIPLRQISDATHIGVRFLQAIEQDNYKILPGGIFNKAFVKSFARYVGLDEEQALAKYQRQLDELGGEPVRSSSRYEVLDDSETSSWSSTLLAALGIIILALGIYGAYKYLQQERKPEEKKAAGNISPTATLPVVEVSPTPTPAETPAPGAVPSVAPGASVSPSPGVSPSPPAGALTLRLQAKDGDCWIKVRADADPKGEMAILKPGESREFTATEKLIVNVGNILALDAMLNGRPAKIPANKGKVVAESILITKDNLQQFIQ
jgi:cytoskeletal protein RodZ